MNNDSSLFFRSGYMKSNPDAQAIYELCSLADDSISFEYICETLHSGDIFEPATIDMISDRLTKAGFENFVARIGPEVAIEESMPFLAVMTELVPTTSPHLSMTTKMLCVERLTGEHAYCRGFGHRSYKTELDDFCKRWTGVCLIPDGKRALRSDDISEDARKGERSRKAFRENLRVAEHLLSNELRDTILRDVLGQEIILDRSLVFASNQVARGRTSRTGRLSPTIEAKVKEVVAVQPEFQNRELERLQLTVYEPGQEFRPHFDAADGIMRPHTCIIYINDDFEGGETVFPFAEECVTPKAGSALIFGNLTEESELNDFSLHAGAPVASGTKVIITAWSRERYDRIKRKMGQGELADFLSEASGEIGLICTRNCLPCEDTLRSLDFMYAKKLLKRQISVFYPGKRALDTARQLGLDVVSFPTFFKANGEDWTLFGPISPSEQQSRYSEFVEWSSTEEH